jgi:hypothetical protein
VRDRNINVRVTKVEYDNLASAAGRHGVSVSDYARAKLFSRSKPDVTYEIEQRMEGLQAAIDTAQQALSAAPKRRRRT